MYSLNVIRECKEKMLCVNVRILCTVQRHNNARMFSRMFMIYDGNIDVRFMTHSRRTLYSCLAIYTSYTVRTVYVDYMESNCHYTAYSVYGAVNVGIRCGVLILSPRDL